MELLRDVTAVASEILGTDIYVPRFNAFMYNAIQKRAEELYPLPDPTPFQKPVPDALIEGDMTPASQNPEYQKAVVQVMLKRNQYWQDAVLSALEVRDTKREQIVAVFISSIEPMRQYVDMPEDNFAAVMRYCVLKPAEYIEVINSARKEQPLTQEEIREGLRIFRRVIQRDAANGHHPEQVAQGLPEVEQVQA